MLAGCHCGTEASLKSLGQQALMQCQMLLLKASACACCGLCRATVTFAVSCVVAPHLWGSSMSAWVTLQGSGGTQACTAGVKGLVLMSFSISNTCTAANSPSQQSSTGIAATANSLLISSSIAHMLLDTALPRGCADLSKQPMLPSCLCMR